MQKEYADEVFVTSCSLELEETRIDLPALRGSARGRYVHRLTDTPNLMARFRRAMEMGAEYSVFPYTLTETIQSNRDTFFRWTFVHRGTFHVTRMGSLDEDWLELCSMTKARHYWNDICIFVQFRYYERNHTMTIRLAAHVLPFSYARGILIRTNRVFSLSELNEAIAFYRQTPAQDIRQTTLPWAGITNRMYPRPSDSLVGDSSLIATFLQNMLVHLQQLRQASHDRVRHSPLKAWLQDIVHEPYVAILILEYMDPFRKPRAKKRQWKRQIQMVWSDVMHPQSRVRPETFKTSNDEFARVVSQRVE